MANWLYNKGGHAEAIHDDDCIRSGMGHVRAWVVGSNVYSLHGRHIGWFEDGVLYDSHNRALGFLPEARGYLSGRPGLAGAPGMPGFAGRPGRPGLSGVPGRAGYGGWSAHDLAEYLEEDR